MSTTLRTVPLGPRRLVRFYVWLTWLVGSAFGAYVVWRAFTETQSASVNEAHSILFGAWLLQSHHVVNSSFAWTNGATLWPLIASTAYSIGALSLVRYCAVACALVAYAATIGVTRQLFDDVAALWATVGLSLCGVLWLQSDSATPTNLALAGVSVAAWGIARAIRQNNRTWLILAGLAYAVALLASYGTCLALIPLVAMLLVRRRSRWKADLLVFGWAVATVLLLYFTPASALLLSTLGADGMAGILAHPSAGFAVDTWALWYVVPAVAGLGALALAHNQPLIVAFLFSGCVLGAAYDLLYASQPSGQNALLLGYVFGYPLVGLFLARIWGAFPAHPTFLGIAALLSKRASVLLVVMLLGAVGVSQLNVLPVSQAPMSSVVRYATAHIQPGDSILVGALDPVILTLYERGNIRALDDVYDLERASQMRVDLCAFDWVVDPGIQPESDTLRAQLQACAVYSRVYSGDATLRDIGPGLKAQWRQQQDVIYVNTLGVTHQSG
ncbi:MAG TPA: glycosyltransferase family 39 protein [Ktedonobacterales bacterium]